MSRRAAFAGILAASTLVWGVAGATLAHSHIATNIDVRDSVTDTEPVEGGVITVCQFYLVAYIDGPDPNGRESGFWRITDNATGDLVDEGQWLADEDDPPDRIPDSGFFTLPEGSYNLWWDHEEFVPGGSHREKDFAVVCPASTPSPAPTGSVAPTASAPPTGSPAPTGSVAPTASASQPPGGSVLPTTGGSPGGGAGITLPPTDTAIAASRASTGDSSVAPIAIALGLLAGFVFLLTPRPARVRTPVRHRR